MTDEERDAKITEMHAAVVGVNGQGGLIQQVKDNTANIFINTKGLIRLKVVVAATVILALGSGVGVNIDKLIDYLTR